MSVVLLASLDAAAAGIAFHYATPLTPRELGWYANFDVLVTHDPLPRAQVDALHRKGTKLVLYEWAVAYYASLATSWHRTVPLLNKTPLRGHLGANDADAFYYDPATQQHREARADFLARRLKAIGYDGVFLDTTTAASVHPLALAEYTRRHPGVSYDAAFAGFLAKLSKVVEVVVTNQGYRAAAHVLPYVDWDVSESLITRPVNGRFVLRPWNDPKDPWNSTAYLMKHLIAPVRKKFPRVRYGHINYVNDPALVGKIVAIARLFDAEAVVARADTAKMLTSDLLLHDFGRAHPRVDRASGAYRFYEHGFVGYNAGSQPMRVRAQGRTIIVPPASAVFSRWR
ncbi:MAG: hypothetical protein ACLGH0_12010 [Thermoanaerobaculia bacterium]